MLEAGKLEAVKLVPSRNSSQENGVLDFGEI
jgi:hypothetical protein